MLMLVETVLLPEHSSASSASFADLASFQRQVESATGRAYHISIGVRPVVGMQAVLVASAGIVELAVLGVWLCVAAVVDSLHS